jgi:hypothetical protein
MRHSGILLHGWKITGDSGERSSPPVTDIKFSRLKKVHYFPACAQSKPLFNESLTASAVVTVLFFSCHLPHAGSGIRPVTTAVPAYRSQNDKAWRVMTFSATARHVHFRRVKLKKTMLSTALFSMLFMSAFAQAEGCLKGAVAGGVVGHLKHHAVLGAVAGCAIGHHLAAQAKKQQAAAK